MSEDLYRLKNGIVCKRHKGRLGEYGMIVVSIPEGVETYLTEGGEFALYHPFSDPLTWLGGAFGDDHDVAERIGSLDEAVASASAPKPRAVGRMVVRAGECGLYPEIHLELDRLAEGEYSIILERVR